MGPCMPQVLCTETPICLPRCPYLLVLQLVLALPDDVAFLQQLLLGLLKLLLALQWHDMEGVSNISLAREPLLALGHPCATQPSSWRARAKHRQKQSCLTPHYARVPLSKTFPVGSAPIPMPTWRWT